MPQSTSPEKPSETRQNSSAGAREDSAGNKVDDRTSKMSWATATQAHSDTPYDILL